MFAKKHLHQAKDELRKVHPAGLVMSGPGMAGEMSSVLEVIFSGLVGALAGFAFGMLCGSLARVFTINRVKGMIGGRHWAAWGAGAGALGLAMFELFT
jgi:hypothetical protein